MTDLEVDPILGEAETLRCMADKFGFTVPEMLRNIVLTHIARES